MTKTTNPALIAYRPDIDGLRAFAVMSVFLFHLDFKDFSGGFVGVDVFFVISGFLITNLIKKEVDDGTFTFANFYFRRILRLFPAIFFVVFLSFIFGFLLLSPTHFESFCESAIYAILATSNFLFWKDSGYFDIEASVKPLLHTWSLGVEEQFYLVWPAIMVALLWTRRKWIAVLFLSTTAIASLVSTQSMLAVDPQGAFFLTPFRVTEFIIGAALVWTPPLQSKQRIYLEPIFLLGFTMIAYPIFFYTDSTPPFPGLYALLPCMGAAFAIYGGSSRSSGVILRNRLAVGIGLISYSLYLLHWPLIVFFKYWRSAPLTLTEQLSIIVCTIAGATLMYYFIEQPFRRPKQFAGRKSNLKIAGFCTAFSLLVIIPAGHAATRGGWEWRLSREALDINKIAQNFKFRNSCRRFVNDGTHQICFFGRGNEKEIDLLSFGDSHAEMLVAGLDEFLRTNNKSGLLVTAGGTLPFISTSTFRGERAPKFTFANSMEQLSTVRPKMILLHARFALHWHTVQAGVARQADIEPSKRRFVVSPSHNELTKESSQMAFVEGLDNTLSFFSERGLKVLIIGSIPELGTDPRTCLTRPNYLTGLVDKSQCRSVTFEEAFSRADEINSVIRERAKKYKNVKFFDPAPIICSHKPSGFCDMFIDNKLIYRDGHHISTPGAQFIVSQISKTLLEMMK